MNVFFYQLQFAGKTGLGFAENDVKFPITSEIKRRFKTTEEGVSEMCEVIERNRAEAAIEEKKKMLLV